MLCKGRFPFFAKLALSWGYGTTVASHGTTATSTTVIFTATGRAVLPLCVWYFRPGGTTAMTRGTASSRAGGGQERAGGVPTPPYPFNSVSPLCLSLSPAQERRWRTLPDLHLRPLFSHSARWDCSPPRPLAMEQGFSPNPSLFALLFCLNVLGRCKLFLRF